VVLVTGFSKPPLLEACKGKSKNSLRAWQHKFFAFVSLNFVNRRLATGFFFQLLPLGRSQRFYLQIKLGFGFLLPAASKGFYFIKT
jgi:hypothetical protein